MPQFIVSEGKFFLTGEDVESNHEVKNLMEKYHLCRADAENVIVLMQERGIGEEEAVFIER